MRRLIAAGLLLAAPIAARAQDGSEATGPARTAEGAGRFLTEFFAGDRIHSLVHSRVSAAGVGPYADGQPGRWVQWHNRIARVAAPAICRMQVEMSELVPTMFTPPIEDVPTAPAAMAVEIDWAKVKQVIVAAGPQRFRTGVAGSERSATSVQLKVADHEHQPPLFLFDTKEEADRVGFAMDFLQRECAPKSAMGF